MPPTERRILIVDDSPEDRATIRRYLSRERDFCYQFDEAGTGTAALDACRVNPPDCILLDYDLPDLDGLELVGILAPDRQKSTIPIVMLTGRGAESIAVLALKAGAHDYLVKGSYNGAILQQTIEEAIGKVRTQREVEAQRVEMERLYGEIREADGRKDDFLAVLAHELRNPLSTILNAVHILNLRQAERPDDERLTGMIERQVRHLCRLVDDLLDVSRISQGKIQLRTQPAEFNSLVSQAVENLRGSIEHRRQTLLVNLADGPVPIEADPTRIEQVVVNLLNNASKYTDTGGTIVVDVDREGEWVTLSVRDNGVGISPEMIARVFEMFSQAESSLDRSQGGLGIGLTLVRNLVQMHGGEVAARSEGLGLGSEFTVRLPIAAPAGAAPAPEAPPAEPEAPPARQATRVLVVDDNIHAAQSLAMVIQLWQHETRLAHTGTDAIEQAILFDPEVILLDIGLPGRDGYSVAEEIRRLPELRGKLLIAMTGYGRDSDFARSRQAGFDHHLVKPLDFDDLEILLSDLDAARRKFRADSAFRSG